MHVVRGQNGQAMRPCQRIKAVNPRPIITTIKIASGDVFQRRQCAFYPPEPCTEMAQILAWDRDQLHTCTVFRKIIQRDVASPLLLPRPIHTVHFAFRQQRAKPPISSAVSGIS